MRSNFGRVALGIAAVAAAVVLLIVLQDGGEGEPAGGPPAVERPDPAGDADRREGPTYAPGLSGSGRSSVPTVVVVNGAPVGGVAELDFEAGEQVRFRVRSDRADELHVHGYDVERELPAGLTVRIEFPATIEGIFEVELHESGEQIAELRVNP